MSVSAEQPPATALPSEHTQGTPCNGALSEAHEPRVGSPSAYRDVERRRLVALEGQDHRDERRLFGVVRWKPEHAVPDVGGMGWRSRTGQLLKNQTFYAGDPAVNLWDNPTHAGPRTWKYWHGPRLRTDASLMHRLDGLDEEQAAWDTRKAVVNTLRVEALDRLNHQKVENAQREKASTWAPHRRPRKDAHESLGATFGFELDAMPEKELKKVLTGHVLRKDQEAVLNITKRIQVEETWKAAWKQMEQNRRLETLSDLAHRTAYQDMLMELSGQPKMPRDPNRHLPNNCTPRLEELAQPHRPIEPCEVDVTQLNDFKGLYHVTHKHAMEARFPGVGHDHTQALAKHATAKAQAGWPPPEATLAPAPPEMPRPAKKRTTPRRSLGATGTAALHRGTLPVPQHTVSGLLHRNGTQELAMDAKDQHLTRQAPPPPDQRKTTARGTLVSDADAMSATLAIKSAEAAGNQKVMSKEGVAPIKRATVYPVLVPTVEPNMERPGWKPKRTSSSVDGRQGPRARGAGDAGHRGAMTARGSRSTAADAQGGGGGAWPPIGTRAVDITIRAARCLPKADRSGHSDPYAVCEIPGKPRSRVKTRVLGDTEDPEWNEELVVEGWRPGDDLVFAVYDFDLVGADDKLASITVSAPTFFPSGYEGTLDLQNNFADATANLSLEQTRHNKSAAPKLEVRIVAQEATFKGTPRERVGKDYLSMPDVVPTLAAVCDQLEDFDARLQQAPRHGNFWKTPRGNGLMREFNVEPVPLSGLAGPTPASTASALAASEQGL